MNYIKIQLEENQLEGTSATVNQWLHNIGDTVTKNQPLIELETDKVMMEIISPDSGILKEIHLNPGDEVNANSVLGIIEISSEEKQKQNSASSVKKSSINEPEIIKTPELPIDRVQSSVLISPSVRRMIKKHNLDLSLILGTGKNNRITTRDINNYLKTQSNNSVDKSQHIPHTSMRRNIANHMVDSLLHTAPHVTSVFNLDMSTIINHRNANKQMFSDKGVKLTFTAYFIAASSMAIKSVPIVNSQFHKDSIEVFNNINIGIGTSLDDKGLIVPVLKNCQNKDLFAIAKELTLLTEKARNNSLNPSDVKDGTFTISNHGVSGSLVATPIIINQPQSAILGVGKMEKRVVVKEFDNEDVMTIKPMCYVSLTIDHRVLDAHQTNQFLSVFVDILENWK